jgi:hypothetical protein
MTTRTNLIAAINNAANLDALCDAMNALRDDLGEHEREEEIVDITSLPTFGDVPNSTANVWSWDDTRQMEFGQEWYLTPRADLDA